MRIHVHEFNRLNDALIQVSLVDFGSLVYNNSQTSDSSLPLLSRVVIVVILDEETD